MECHIQIVFIFASIVSALNSGSYGNEQQSNKIILTELICLDDYEAAALQLLNFNALIYYQPGADEEITVNDNRLAFRRLIILPRMLQDVSNRFLSTVILGKLVAFPVGVAPTALQKMAHPGGEIATVRAAETAGTIFILSTLSNTKLEDVAHAAPNARKWMQIYVFKNRLVTQRLIQRAVAAGFEALVITVDAPLNGKRRETSRHRFVLPSNLRLANFEEETRRAMDSGMGTTVDSISNVIDKSLTWKDIGWLKSLSNLPVIVKGVLTPQDAELAIQAGVSAIIVSNHGGRQLDTVSATIDALSPIIKQVEGRCEVYLDGGVRTGTNVFKALALGAKMVFLGRPIIYGLAVNGETGATAILNIIKNELNRTMALAGVSRVNQIGKTFISRSEAAQCYNFH